MSVKKQLTLLGGLAVKLENKDLLLIYLMSKLSQLYLCFTHSNT